MKSVNEYLNLLPYWESLNEDEKDLVRHNSKIRYYEKDKIIHGCSETCLGMIYVLEGNIRVYILSGEGREITLFRFEKGDSCVLSSSCVISQITFETQMVAETYSGVLIVNSGVFAKIAEENIYVRCYMYEALTNRFSSVMWTLQQILFARFDQRLASFLLSEYERTGNKEIHMTHEQIAQHVNSAREVVARMIKRFSSDGMVESKRGSVYLKDVDELKKLI